jgi:hypothetical protein
MRPDLRQYARQLILLLCRDRPTTTLRWLAKTLPVKILTALDAQTLVAPGIGFGLRTAIKILTRPGSGGRRLMRSAEAGVPRPVSQPRRRVRVQPEHPQLSAAPIAIGVVGRPHVLQPLPRPVALYAEAQPGPGGPAPLCGATRWSPQGAAARGRSRVTMSPFRRRVGALAGASLVSCRVLS